VSDDRSSWTFDDLMREEGIEKPIERDAELADSIFCGDSSEWRQRAVRAIAKARAESWEAAVDRTAQFIIDHGTISSDPLAGARFILKVAATVDGLRKKGKGVVS
jgi:hypothetical protein